jgi:ATP-dependent Clp protease protease subunit
MNHLNRLLQLLRDNATTRAEGMPAVRVETTSDTEAHVYVYDVIDAWWGASAAALIEALKGAGDRDLHLHINSPGGDVFEARAMGAAVVAYPGKVTSHIDGLAASAATYLALSANDVRMTDGGLFMIHNSWTLAWGNKKDLRDTADLLEKVDGSIANDYSRKTKKALDQITAWMDATTWFTAAEAKDAGFIDVVDANTKRDDATSAQASAEPLEPERLRQCAEAARASSSRCDLTSPSHRSTAGQSQQAAPARHDLTRSRVRMETTYGWSFF